MSSVSDGTAGAGRPREERVDRAIADAAFDLMAEQGITGLRMETLAERAGVGKAAIYRRFRSKDELVASVIARMVDQVIVIPDTGSTARDLRVLMDEAIELYRDTSMGRLMPALVETMRRAPDLAQSFRDGFLRTRRAALAAVIERGIERGDLDPGLDMELTLDVLGGPLFYRLLITGAPLDDDLAAGVVDLILKANAPAAPHSKERR